MGKSRNNETKTVRKNEEALKSNSTVFSDPYKKEAAEVIAAKKKKKRIITAIVSVLVALIVVLPWGIAKIIESNKAIDANVVPLKTRLERHVKDSKIEPSDKAKTLYSLKNDDPTDVAAAKLISSHVGVTAYCGEYELLAIENDTGYTLRFVFKKPHSTSVDEEFGKLMEDFSIVFMALVDGVTAVEWSCPSGVAEGEVTSEQITLERVKEVLKGDPKEYAASEKTVHYMLTEYGLHDMSD